jgi:methionyl-tRNA synthetase
MPHISEVEDLDRPNRGYPIIEGDYSAQHGTWKRLNLVAGTSVPPPVPVFTKLDDDIVEQELERMRSEA